jgi:endonuclease G
MIPKSTIDQTRARFNERTPTREALAAGSPIAANTPERVQQRIARVMAAEGVRALVIPTPGAVAAPVAVNVLERILGKNDLMSITFLESAVRAAKTVARIRIRRGTQTVGYGTGSLVAPGVLMTNNHVLGSAGDAANSLAEFNYQDGIQTPTVFGLDPNSLFITDPALDYTLVAVGERGTGQAEVGSFGFNRLIEQQGKILIGESLNIIQHPNGELKQVAIRENQLKDILPQFLHYHTDTAPGSSGSPVFNDQWELVALHHSGVPETDAQGRYLTVDGTVWEPAMGEHRIHWKANEGARVSQIVAHLKNQSLSGTARTLRDSIFTAQSKPLAVGTPARPQPEQSSGRVQLASDGTATWTFPIQISIQVGGQTAPPTATAGAPFIGSGVTPVMPTTPLTPAPSADLQAALDAAEAGKQKKYYDKAKDGSDRSAYYADIDTSVSGKTLFEALSTLLESTHSPQSAYKPAIHVYPFVDLHPDRKLRSIYSQKAFEPEELIREDFRIEQERAERLQERMRNEATLSPEKVAEAADLLEAQLPFNCEHVVPQSWFDKDEPMRGDLHHLFACEPACNSFRGNIPYFDFPDFEEAIRDECGKRDGTRFEPGAAKGIVARATLYFLLRYPGNIKRSYDAARLATLLSWHSSHPVTDYERHRNMAIFEKQGNRNPLIDNPEWATEIDFKNGL